MRSRGGAQNQSAFVACDGRSGRVVTRLLFSPIWPLRSGHLFGVASMRNDFQRRHSQMQARRKITPGPRRIFPLRELRQINNGVHPLSTLSCVGAPVPPRNTGIAALKWHFSKSSLGWEWYAHGPSLEIQKSRRTFPTLLECMEDAKQNGYPTHDERLGLLEVRIEPVTAK